jgi:hypothetical protein
LTFSSPQTPSAHHHRPPTARRRQWRSTLWQDRDVPVNRRPSNLPSPTPAGTYGNPNRKPGGRHPAGEPVHQENEVCNNYSVISTRLCLFNHNRHRALSMTCNPTPRPKFRRVFVSQYIYMRTIIPAQNVPRGTLYVQPWATGRCGSRRKTPSSGRTWANRLGVGIALLTDCGV